MSTLRELSSQIVTMFRVRGARMAKSAFVVKVLAIPAFSAVAGICQFTEFENGHATIAQVLVITASTMVGVSSLLIGIFEKDGADELAKAYEAVEQARQIQEDYGFIVQLERDHDRSIQHGEALLAMRGFLEQLLVSPSGSEEDVIQGLLAVSARPLAVAMAFEQTQAWTITVYRAECDTGDRSILRPIATARAIECDLANARSWEEGTGIAGAAWSNRSEVVIPDLARPGIKELFGTKVNVEKLDDFQLYRSMAASPIRLDGRAEPWGVVVATNDSIDHFSTDRQSELRPDLVLKNLSAMVALAAAAYRRIEPLARAATLAIEPSTPAGTSSPPASLGERIQGIFSGRRAEV